MRAWRRNLQALARNPPRGGVGHALQVSHTPADLSTPLLTSPGPRGLGDSPDAGLLVLPAALLHLPVVGQGDVLD